MAQQQPVHQPGRSAIGSAAARLPAQCSFIAAWGHGDPLYGHAHEWATSTAHMQQLPGSCLSLLVFLNAAAASVRACGDGGGGVGGWQPDLVHTAPVGGRVQRRGIGEGEATHPLVILASETTTTVRRGTTESSVAAAVPPTWQLALVQVLMIPTPDTTPPIAASSRGTQQASNSIVAGVRSPR